MAIETEILKLVETAVTNTVKNGLQNYLQTNLFGYNSPFQPLVEDAVAKLELLPSVIQDIINELVQEPVFKQELKAALRKRLVNELVKSFALENAFKQLRNNPETKQKLVQMLEGLVNG